MQGVSPGKKIPAQAVREKKKKFVQAENPPPPPPPITFLMVRPLLDKSMWFVCLIFLKKGFFCLYEKYVFSPVPFLCMIFAEITFCSSINLEQPVMVLVLLFLTYQLSCRMRYLILSVLVQRLFFLMDISLNIMYLVGICICYVF